MKKHLEKYILIVFIVLLVACAVSPASDAVEVQQLQVSNETEVFQFLGEIGHKDNYSVWRMVDGDTTCYIVVDEYVYNTRKSLTAMNTNAAPAIHCP